MTEVDIDATQMWRRRYVDVQAVLDDALGDDEGGEGIAQDVALLAAQRDQAVARRDAAYAELEEAVRERDTAEAKLAWIDAICRGVPARGILVNEAAFTAKRILAIINGEESA